VYHSACGDDLRKKVQIIIEIGKGNQMRAVFRSLSMHRLLRSFTLPVLKFFNFNFYQTHPWVPGARVWMNSYLHKGYWFFGKAREAETMALFRQLIQAGDRVVEVGGHIGFISAFFSYCVGAKGMVSVLEPGSNNLPYIRKNVSHIGLSNFGPIQLIEAAAGPENGNVTFYEDHITGQNNSVVKNFPGLEENAKLAFLDKRVRARQVELVALDSKFFGQSISFVKIDVEGFELGVLSGMTTILSEQKPILMVEIQADHLAIFDLLHSFGYMLFSQAKEPINDPLSMKENNFALHREKHAVELQKFFHTKG
jgi:FkbM family methyltransferase